MPLLRKTVVLNLVLAGLVSTAFVSRAAVGKGLDQLKANQPEAPADQKAPKESGSGEGEGEGKAASGDLTKAKAPEQPGPLSRALANNLSITTSLGVGTLSASKGSWAGRGMGDLGLAYAFTQGSRMRLASSFRYVPFVAEVASDNRPYQGVVEGYHFGLRSIFTLHEGLTVFGSGELGYMMVHVHSYDGQEDDTELSKDGVDATLGGGVDWAFGQKIGIGPRLYVGFGRFQTIQLAAAGTFIF